MNKKNICLKIILHKYILGRPTYVRIFPVDLGLPLIFTDFQQFQLEKIFSQRLYLSNFNQKLVKPPQLSEPSDILAGKISNVSNYC